MNIFITTWQNRAFTKSVAIFTLSRILSSQNLLYTTAERNLYVNYFTISQKNRASTASLRIFTRTAYRIIFTYTQNTGD